MSPSLTEIILGQYSKSVCCPRFFVPNHENFGTVQHLGEKTRKGAVLPQKTNPRQQKCCTVQKTKNNLLEPVRPAADRRPQRLGLSSMFASFDKKIGTIQYFCEKNQQQCCNLSKFWLPNHENLRTVQHCCKKTNKSVALSQNCWSPTYIFISVYVYVTDHGARHGSLKSRGIF